MSLQGHIVELQRRHEALQKEIEKEQLHPNADETKIIGTHFLQFPIITNCLNCRQLQFITVSVDYSLWPAACPHCAHVGTHRSEKKPMASRSEKIT